MPILSYESPALEEILSSLLYRSDNMYAESVSRILGQHLGGGSARKDGAAAVETVLRQWGVSTDGIDIYDGSGLGRANRITPLFLSNVLRAAALDWDCGDIFPSLLPVAGENGTVRSLLKESVLSGGIALKSGSMTGVKCYAGYYPARHPEYAVVLMVNNYRCNGADLKKQSNSCF